MCIRVNEVSCASEIKDVVTPGQITFSDADFAEPFEVKVHSSLY